MTLAHYWTHVVGGSLGVLLVLFLLGMLLGCDKNGFDPDEVPDAWKVLTGVLTVLWLVLVIVGCVWWVVV